MSPFQEFRLWLHRSPRGERAAAAVATALIVAVLAWVLVPSANSGTTATGFGPSGAVGTTQQPAAPSGGTQSVTAPGGVPVGGQPVQGAGAPVQGGAPGAPGASGAPGPSAPSTGPVGSTGENTPGGHCPAASGSVHGVTPSVVKIGIAIVDIAGPAANSAFGIDDPKVYQAEYQAVIDSINKSGGVACRKLVPQYYKANPADQAQMQATCLDMAQAGLFAVIDLGEYGAAPSTIPCFAQHHMLFFSAYSLVEKMREQFYPYLYGFDTFDHLYHNTVFGLRQRGFFDPGQGFKKLGILYHTCSPQLMQEELGWLHQIGLQDSQIDTYSFGCPQGFASPSDVQQAVLKFRGDGVTNVTYVDALGDWPNFTKFAQSQGYKPRYGLPNDNIISIAYSNLAPDPNNIADALAITDSRDAEDRTAGMKPTPGTARCMKILRPAGHSHPSEFPNPDYPLSGNPCDVLWMLQAAMNHATELTPPGIEAGLRAAGSIDFAFPQGPNHFSAAGVTTAGQFWRTAQFFLSCKCWRVVDRQFHPSFP